MGPGQGGAGCAVGISEADGPAKIQAIRQDKGIDLVGHRFLGQAAPIQNTGNPVANLHPMHIGAGLGDDADRFRTGHKGQGRLALIASRDHQRGRKTDARSLGFDAQLPRLQGLRWAIFHPQILEFSIFLDQNTTHDAIPYLFSLRIHFAIKPLGRIILGSDIEMERKD